MKQFSMSIPDAIYASLAVEGKALEQEPGEVVKAFLLHAYKQEGGGAAQPETREPNAGPKPSRAAAAMTNDECGSILRSKTAKDEMTKV